jgi:hypothetical protein
MGTLAWQEEQGKSGHGPRADRVCMHTNPSLPRCPSPPSTYPVAPNGPVIVEARVQGSVAALGGSGAQDSQGKQRGEGSHLGREGRRKMKGCPFPIPYLVPTTGTW